MEDNGIIPESENFRANEKAFGYKEIVMSAINHTRTIGAKEMKEGFMVYSKASPGRNDSDPIKYVGDTRKEYCQSVEMVYDLLFPKIAKHKKTIEEIEAIFKEVEDLFLHRKSKYVVYVAKNKEMQELNWDIADFYWLTRIELYRKLFRRLCLFCEEELGWMEEVSIEE